MDSRKHIIKNLRFHLRQVGEIELSDIDIYDDDMQGEVHKATRIFNNENNEILVELDNGEEIDIEELNYNELICIYEEII